MTLGLKTPHQRSQRVRNNHLKGGKVMIAQTVLKTSSTRSRNRNRRRQLQCLLCLRVPKSLPTRRRQSPPCTCSLLAITMNTFWSRAHWLMRNSFRRDDITKMIILHQPLLLEGPEPQSSNLPLLLTWASPGRRKVSSPITRAAASRGLFTKILSLSLLLRTKNTKGQMSPTFKHLYQLMIRET